MLLVTLLMINRSQVIEGSRGTRASVATLGLDPAGVFLGKALALAVELWLTAHCPARGGGPFAPHRPDGLARSAAERARHPGRARGGRHALRRVKRRRSRTGHVVAGPLVSRVRPAAHRRRAFVLADALHGGALWQWWVISLVALAAYLAIGILLYGVLEES